MSAPVTNQLEERRKQREAREAAACAKRAAARAKTPEAARDLLTGLITGSSEPTDDPGPDANTQSDRTRPGAHEQCTAESDTGLSAAPDTTLSRRGEDVGELVRRVQEGTAARIGEASATRARRRPTGTVDLPARPAVPRRRSPRRLRHRDGNAAHSRMTRQGGLRRWTAAMLPVAGITVLMVALNVGDHNTPRSLDTSLSKPVHAAAITNPLSATAATIAHELGAFAQPAPRASRAAHPQQKHPRPHHARHLRAPAPDRHHASVKHARAVAQSSATSAATTPPHTSTPPATAVSATNQSSATSSQPSATSSSRRPGPTNPGPLGGIGSCVSGCT